MIDSTVKVKERERGYRESEAVLGLAVSMITGGVCLDDLVVLREEETFKAIWRHRFTDIAYAYEQILGLQFR